jgi:hypothetical protein
VPFVALTGPGIDEEARLPAEHRRLALYILQENWPTGGANGLVAAYREIAIFHYRRPMISCYYISSV